MSGHVVLVGLPGVGKSAVGRAVATRLGRGFVDFDEEIARRERQSVAEIFRRSGEAYFRAAELALTLELREQPGMILAPGGGWISNPAAVGLLRPPARLLYLRATPATVVRRMGEAVAARPLLAGASAEAAEAAVAQLLERRRSQYEGADWVLDTELLDLQGVVDSVIALVSPSGSGYVNH